VADDLRYAAAQFFNANGHGVDIIARKPDGSADGSVKVVEVKTTRVNKAPSLSKPQQMGGKDYTDSRLEVALKNPATMADALKAQEWLKNSTSTDYEVQQVRLTQGEGGIVTAQLGISKAWGAPH
jgi:hypothetical protein